MELKHNNHSVGQSAYHFVFRPKYNVSVFRHPYPKKVCEDAFNEVAEKHNISIYEIKVMPDHVNMFVGLPTQSTKIIKLINQISFYSVMRQSYNG